MIYDDHTMNLLFFFSHEFPNEFEEDTHASLHCFFFVFNLYFCVLILFNLFPYYECGHLLRLLCTMYKINAQFNEIKMISMRCFDNGKRKRTQNICFIQSQQNKWLIFEAKIKSDNSQQRLQQRLCEIHYIGMHFKLVLYLSLN